MNNLTIFKYQARKVRIITQNGETWFVAKDICDIIGLSDTNKALLALEPTEKGTNLIPTPGGEQSLCIISEPGLYRLLMRSDKPQSKPFQKWVVSEVLPSIRKTGQYGMGIPKTFSEALRLAADQADQIEEQKTKLIEQAPKVAFSDDFQSAVGNILIRQLAKKLGTGEKRLFDFLKKKLILLSSSEPYQRYAQYFHIKTGIHEQKDIKVAHQTLEVTPKGQYWIYKLWTGMTGQNELLPAIEKSKEPEKKIIVGTPKTCLNRPRQTPRKKKN
jgi:anti-repressor protein